MSRKFGRKGVKKMIRNALKKEIELKFEEDIAGVTPGANWSRRDLTALITAGVGQGQRVGDEVSIKLFNLRLQMEPNITGTTMHRLRVAVIVPRDEAYFTTNILTGMNINDYFEPNEVQRVLFDKFFYVDQPYVGGPMPIIEKKIKLGRFPIKVKYHLGTAVPIEGNVLICYIADTGAAGEQPTLYFQERLFYTDA